MVELVFVIVILGILAAIAIPKLAATRDDAVNATLAQNIMTGSGEIATYAIAHGETTTDLSEMSNAISSLVLSGKAILADHEVNIIRGVTSDCVKVRVDQGTNEENLTISLGDASNDSDCLNLQRLIDMRIYPMVLRGKHVIQ